MMYSISKLNMLELFEEVTSVCDHMHGYVSTLTSGKFLFILQNTNATEELFHLYSHPIPGNYQLPLLCQSVF